MRAVAIFLGAFREEILQSLLACFPALILLHHHSLSPRQAVVTPTNLLAVSSANAVKDYSQVFSLLVFPRAKFFWSYRHIH